ncbi:hypothetical protein GMDG_03693 [Pseudogymnoascus destructans 20631-21]|uniref:Uncharacterized protein n=1 Tax=Pseudogymnoascus destructans (strain ATCC MYA-4855 / 20631-21) TaxID=658429 RepID=L8G916_PSED2|nr:hypothetical protein GMDG_03693 [Pseudogymnoascus destructans 20631-21]
MNLRRTAATRLMTISRIVVGPQSLYKTLLWGLGVIRVRGDAVARGVLLYFELTPSAIRRDSDDMIVNFRVARVWSVQEWSHNTTDTKIQEFSMVSQIYNQLNS